MDLLLYRMTCNMKIVSRLCIDPNYLEVAAVGDQRGWAVAPCRSHHGSPGEKIFAGLQLKDRIKSRSCQTVEHFIVCSTEVPLLLQSLKTQN